MDTFCDNPILGVIFVSLKQYSSNSCNCKESFWVLFLIMLKIFKLIHFLNQISEIVILSQSCEHLSTDSREFISPTYTTSRFLLPNMQRYSTAARVTYLLFQSFQSSCHRIAVSIILLSSRSIFQMSNSEWHHHCSQMLTVIARVVLCLASLNQCFSLNTLLQCICLWGFHKKTLLV